VPITLAGLRRYPVKSCRGEDLESALVQPWGLEGDRRWMLVDPDGEKVTARETHVLLTIVPELVTGGVRLTAPGSEPLLVAEPRIPDTEVRIWSDRVVAASAGPEADAWFTAVAGRPLRLVFLDDPTRRAVNPEKSRPGDVVTFADGYPMLLASLDSLRRLNEWIDGGPSGGSGGGTSAGPSAGTEPLDVRRFRPNLVIEGAEPFAEDTWSRIRVGGTTFRVAQDCSRCVLTTVHPDTIVRGHEPIATLSRHRRWEGKVWFAVDLIPDRQPGDPGEPGQPGGTLRVGDEVEVLEATRRREARTVPAPPAA
jgi:uncharacterized protein YcbX